MSKNPQASDFVGIIPAAGIAARLRPSRYVKELLPVAYLVDGQTSSTLPVPVVSLSLAKLKTAGIEHCIVTISDRKPELLRYLGDGSEFGLHLAYVQQMAPTGLAAAVDLAYEWTPGRYGCLLLPDTVIYPSDAMLRLRQTMERERPDLLLGVFPTAIPEQLGPVRFDDDGRVYEILDKPASTDLLNTWAMAIWSPEFSEMLHGFVASFPDSSPVLGDVFNLAVERGMDVRAVWFPEGSFVDIGTVKGLTKMLELAATPELVAQ